MRRHCDVTARLCFRYWPVIDNALREAAFERNVRVRVMASWWKHSRLSLLAFLRSLEALNAAQSTVYHRNMSVQVVCDSLLQLLSSHIQSCMYRRVFRAESIHGSRFHASSEKYSVLSSQPQ